MHTITQARQLLQWALVCASLAFPIVGNAADELPQTSPDGLELQKNTTARVVYLKPGATLGQYQRVAILDCFVDFAKDWQKKFNRDQRTTGSRVTTKDMERIKAGLASAFKTIFTQELQDKGGYQVVDSPAPDVLVLRPAIINLAITAPDLQSPDMNRTIVQSAGQMTLYLELYDSVSDTLLARVLDPQADRRTIARPANSVTNKSAADRILRKWAVALRQHLDAAQGRTAEK
ncbi:MAG: DUF3313 domain-containing protein [Gammaproteobacteria bacterium]|nr:DUF3313 domain-containing protein [Gammaproteobacteria bacterium]